jgi:hypothetical protein
MLPATASLMKNKLSSITKNLLKEQFSFLMPMEKATHR